MSSSEMSAVYLDDMIKDIIHELAFELHWAIKTNHISFEYLYECPTIEDLHVVIQKYRDLKSSAIIKSQEIAAIVPLQQPQYVNCPNCCELVGVQRFAPHLERCMKSKKKTETTSIPSDTKVLKPKKTEISDPFPNSLVVKIKLVKGAIAVKQKRVGVSLEYFNSS